MPRKPKLVTRREIAQVYDVVLQTVTKWEQAGMPVKEPGRKGKPSLFDAGEVAAWLKAREEKAERSGVHDLAHERALREKAQRIATEQATAQKAGKLIRAEDAKKALADEIHRMRSTLLAWERTLPHRIARGYELEGERGVAREIRAAVEELLGQLSKTDDLDAPPDSKRTPKRTAAKKKKRPAKKKRLKKKTSR